MSTFDDIIKTMTDLARRVVVVNPADAPAIRAGLKRDPDLASRIDLREVSYVPIGQAWVMPSAYVYLWPL